MQYGLIGEKLGHSFSREIHARIADDPYELLELTPEEVPSFLQKRDFRGINVTIPYKQTVAPLLDEVSGEARKIGAVNAVVNREGRLYGYNTDYAGAKALLRHAGIDVAGKKTLVLGTGGTSRTMRAVLQELSAGEIVLVSRRPGEGRCAYEEAARLHGDAQIVVNTTPAGMYPNNDGLPLELDAFPRLEGVADVVYNPLRTRLILEARKRGIPAEGGLYMLAAQAVYAAALFRGREAEEASIQRIYRGVLSEKQNLVLIGMPSCGKTTVGRKLAARMGREFWDTDAWVVRKAGRSIAEIFEQEGEAAFRRLEREAVAEAAKKSGVVIATGGGAVLDEGNVQALRQNGALFFLDRPLESLRGTKDRPLSRDPEALRKRYEERYPLYTAICDRRVAVGDTAEQAARQTLAAWRALY